MHSELPRPDAALSQCLALVDSIEQALLGLGDTSHWTAHERLRQRCENFRKECRELVEQKGLDHLAIAFIGPKNAGKTSMLSLLLRGSEITERLRAGVSIASATEKITWIGPRVIRGIDPQFEQAWQVTPTELANLGATYTLVDVPGSNERHQARGEAARRALRAAHLKVLVVEARTMEDAAILDYLAEADGACVLPVVNQIRPGVTSRDVDRFLAKMKAALPNAEILEAILVRDFELESDEDAARMQKQAASELTDRLAETIQQRRLDELLQPQLLGIKSRFEKQLREEMAKELPATAHAVRELKATEAGLATKALEGLLGADQGDRALLSALRQQLRGVYQERTPVLFFPWRTLISLANLLHGALDKVPLLLMGSVPSLLGSAMTAVRNVARGKEFSGDRDNGLRKRAELLVRERLQPQVVQLEAAIRADLHGQQTWIAEQNIDVRFDGLELLQERSTRLFEEALEKQAVSRAGTMVTGFLGMVVFWAIFGWPFVALYKDYFGAIDHLLRGGEHQFPMHALPTLATSFFLAVLPTVFFLLLVLSWASHLSRARRCLADLRRSHQQVIHELSEQGLLRIRGDYPQLRHCLVLLGSG